MGPRDSLEGCFESILPSGHRSSGVERPQKEVETLKEAKLCSEVRVVSKSLGQICCHPGNE